MVQHYLTRYVFVIFSMFLMMGAMLLPNTTEAATYYISTSGSDSNPGSQSAPWRTLQKCANTAVGGDTCLVKPGTYSSSLGGRTTITRGGSASAPIKLRAETPSVQCQDPVNNPDGCFLDRSARTILDTAGGTAFSISGSAAYWDIEGFEIINGTFSRCRGSSLSSGPNNLRFRYLHIHSASNTGVNSSLFEYCRDFSIEHSLFFNPGPTQGGPDYGVALYFAKNVTLRNLWMGGKYNHNISLKRANSNIRIERVVCEGGYECINVGQNIDDNTAISGATQCANVQRGDGSVGAVYDGTTVAPVIRKVFARPMNMGTTHYSLNIGLRMSNVANADIQDYFIANEDGGSATAFRHDDGNMKNWPGGRCGVEPGNNVVRGLTVVSPAKSCAWIGSSGFSPGTLSILNFVCHSAAQGIAFSNTPGNGVQTAWETSQHPLLVLRNGVFNQGTSIFNGAQIESRIDEDRNVAWNFGSLRPGYLSSNPYFRGPATVPNGVANFSHGQKLWDWAGKYQPIMNQFQSTNPSLVDAGVGINQPCTGVSCDIGVNEFLQAMTSAPAPTPVPVPLPTPTVQLSATQVAPGQNVTVTIQGTGKDVTEWVGLYLANSLDSAWSYQSNWMYLNSTQTPPASPLKSAVLTFKAPMEPGTYNFRLFSKSGYQSRLAVSVNLVVTAPKPEPSVVLNAAQYAPGAIMTVKVNGTGANPQEWIGLYLASNPDSSYSYKASWMYLNGTQTAPNAPLTSATLQMRAPMETGTYNVRLFALNGTGKRIAISLQFKVAATTSTR